MIAQKHLAEISCLADACFGSGYLSEHDLLAYDQSPNAAILIDVDADQIRGFTIVQIVNAESIEKHLYFNQSRLNQLIEGHEKIGYRKLTAVSKSHTNKGIGGALIQQGDSFLSERCGKIVSTVWKSGNHTTMEHLLVKNGYKNMGEVENYWSGNSTQLGYKCAKCGSPPCTCSAIVFEKNLV